MAERIDLSVVIPAYNEERRLPATLQEISRHLSDTGSTYEIIVVDDGSTDDTGDVTALQSQSDPCVQLLMTRHAGKGAAVRSGALAARGQRVLFCDADLSMAPEELTRLAGMLGTLDIVIASREGHGARRIGEPYYRHLMGRVFNAFVQMLAIPGIQDTQCGLKCFTQESARRVFSLQTVTGSDSTSRSCTSHGNWAIESRRCPSPGVIVIRVVSIPSGTRSECSEISCACAGTMCAASTTTNFLSEARTRKT